MPTCERWPTSSPSGPTATRSTWARCGSTSSLAVRSSRTTGGFSVRSVAAAGDVPDSVREVDRGAARATVAGRPTPRRPGRDRRHAGRTGRPRAGGRDRRHDRGRRVRRHRGARRRRTPHRSCRAPVRRTASRTPIVRDTVAMAVAPSGRPSLHLAIARGLESVHEPDPRPILADLARHFGAAVPVGPTDRAVQYGRRAAGQAFRAAAYDEAVAHLMAVLELPLEPTDRAELLVDLGLAHLRDGFYEPVAADVRRGVRAGGAGRCCRRRRGCRRRASSWRPTSRACRAARPSN